MIGYVFLLAAWSLLMFVLGMLIRRNDDKSYIETLKGNVDFHKYQKETFVEDARRIVEENKDLKELNTKLINENRMLKQEVDKQSGKTYNIFYKEELK